MNFAKYTKLEIFMKKVPALRPLLAFTPKDVERNVLSFAAAVASSPDLQARLANARAWYAVRDGANWAFGPSKWAGYQGMTAAQYLDAGDGIDGRQTEKRLGAWFDVVPPNSPLHLELVKKLAAFTGQFGKRPSSACRISVIPTSDRDEHAETDDLVALVVRIAQRLDPAHRRAIVRALQ